MDLTSPGTLGSTSPHSLLLKVKCIVIKTFEDMNYKWTTRFGFQILYQSAPFERGADCTDLKVEVLATSLMGIKELKAACRA